MALCKGEAAGHVEEGLAPARARMYCGLELRMRPSVGTLADPSSRSDLTTLLVSDVDHNSNL